METLVRDARPDDEPALGAVFRRSALTNEADRDALLARPELLEFRYPSEQGMVIRVAVGADGRIAGFCTLIENNGFLELEDLFVEPNLMGRGVGKALVRDADELARCRGASSIEVTANSHARGFYERVGFAVVGVADTMLGPAHRMRLEVPSGFSRS